MKIQEKDRYHGAALTQIVEHKSFKALNRATDKYGHYLINADRHVFVKYRTNDGPSWSFIFQPDELSSIADTASLHSMVFLCLVCGNETICTLCKDEIQYLLELSSASSQVIRVEAPKGGSCRIKGTAGKKLGHTIPHNSFPDKLFL